MSSDVKAGAAWREEIVSHLQDAVIGIICVSKTNKNAPWLLFEAGALSRTARNIYLYAIDLDFPEIASGPLSHFKMLSADEKGTSELMQSINGLLGERALPEAKLRQRFAESWPAVLHALPGPPSGDDDQFQVQELAVVLADVVGSTKLSLEAQAIGIQQFFARAKELENVFKGRSIKYLGDSLLATFPDAKDAVGFANELQKSLSRDPIRVDDTAIEARVAIDVGSVQLIRTSYGQDLVGNAINIVARLTPLAIPGEVIISVSARRHLSRPQQEFLGATERRVIKAGIELEFSRLNPTE